MRILNKHGRRTLAAPPTLHPVVPAFENAARTTRQPEKLHTLRTPKSTKPNQKQSSKSS